MRHASTQLAQSGPGADNRAVSDPVTPTTEAPPATSSAARRQQSVAANAPGPVASEAHQRNIRQPRTPPALGPSSRLSDTLSLGPPNARFRQARLAHLRAVTITLFRSRPWMLLPVLATNLALLFASGFPQERVLAVGVLMGLSIGCNLGTAYFLRRFDNATRVLFPVSLGIAVLWASVIALTGGIVSPFTPMLLVLCAANIVAYGRSREATATVVMMCLLTVLVAHLPADWTAVEIVYPYNVAIETTVLLTAFLIFGSTLVAMTDAFDSAGATIERMSGDLLAEVQTRTRSLESLSSRLAHELKNPLVAVKGLSQLMARSAPDERTLNRLAVIASEVTRMEEILRDYLSFSKPLEIIEAGPVELGSLIDDVLGVLEARAANAGVHLVREPGAATVVGDRRRLKEALMNLVANAIEATPKGGHVRVSAMGTEDGARLRVRDTGRGMSAEQLTHLGTPFFTTRAGGTGLGVMLARNVFRQHGGEVDYTSKEGEGTIAEGRLLARPPLESRLPGTQSTAG